MKKSIVTTMIVLAAMISCKKNTTQGPTGPQGPQGATGQSGSASGKIIGFVTFYDQYGTKQKSDTSMVVSIAGTGKTAKVDTSGKYTLSNVSTGEYNLYFSSANYGMGGLPGVSFAGNGSLYVPTVSVSQVPTFSVTFAGAGASGNIVTLVYNVNSSYSAQRKLAIYANNNASVSDDPQHFTFNTNGFITANQTTYTLSLGANIFTSNGYTSGQTVYLKIFPISYNGFSSSTYQDTLTGKTVYTSINKPGAATCSFVMP